MRPARRLSLLLLTALAALALAAPAGRAGTLYTNNYNEKELAALTIGADGLLTPLTGSPFPLPHYFDGLAITPDGRLMVTAFGFEDMIGTQSLALDGAPSQAAPPIPAAVQGSTPPAISPDGRFAYVAVEPSGFAAFAIAGNGSLSRIGGVFGEGGGLPALTTDGRFLFAPNYLGTSIERFAVQPDGSLAALGSVPLGVESPSLLRVTPNGRYAILLSEPMGNDDIRSFAIGGDGSLAPTGSELKTTGAISGSPVVSPDGRFLYNANGNEDSITAYAIDAGGALSQAGAPIPAGIENPEGLAMSADGRFLYAERFQGETVQAFSVGADGALTQIGGPTSTGGESDGVFPVARPSAPIAAIAAVPEAPQAKTDFDASGSIDAAASIVSYSWDFGDGTTLTGPDPKVSHRYKRAGVYAVRLRLSDSNGCGGFSYTGQTAYCAGREATLSVDTPPAIRALRMQPALVKRKHGKHKAKASKRTKPLLVGRPAFLYLLTEKANVTFAIQRKLSGRMVRGQCRRKTKGNAKKRRCLLIRERGSFAMEGRRGSNRTPLPKRLGGKPLKPGAYKATAIAVDSAGGQSRPRSVDFAIGGNRPRPR